MRLKIKVDVCRRTVSVWGTPAPLSESPVDNQTVKLYLIGLGINDLVNQLLKLPVKEVWAWT